MLNECLAVGRSITLPSTASGGAKAGAAVTGAYARIRKQFGLSVGRFEAWKSAGPHRRQGVQDQRAVAGHRRRGDRGDVPSVPSAIAKYHCTNMSREVISDMMDVIGGKGIILGPRNFAGRSWQAAPIAITVEGANIMTRSLLIFGQGAILCHPWVLKMKAAQDPIPVPACRSSIAACSATSAWHLQCRAFVLVRPDRCALRCCRATPTPAATSASWTVTRPTWR
jgi:acyl-CoA dehydrogenase